MKKKITLLFLICSFIFTLSGCSLLLDIFLGGNWDDYGKVNFKKISYATENNKEYFFVQVNKSSYNTILELNTAKVVEEGPKPVGPRFIEDENDSIQEEIEVDNNVFIPYALDQRFAELAYEKLKTSERAGNSETIKLTTRKIDNETGNTKEFYVLNSPNQKLLNKIEFKNGYNGKYCKIWYENTDSSFNPSSTECYNLSKVFDDLCLLEEEVLGSHIYNETIYTNVISPQDKIEIVIFDIEGDEQKNSGATTYGYFNQNDMLIGSNSNKSQMICIDRRMLKENTDQTYLTIAHEFNHLLNFCKKTVEYNENRKANTKMETWFTEMLAMLSEDMLQKKLNIGDINSPKERLFHIDDTGPVINPENDRTTGFLFNFEYGFIKNWDPGIGNPNDCLRAYANSYAFGAYLVRNYGGFNLLHEIATNEYVNEKAIIEAVKKCTNNDITFDDLLINEYSVLLNNSSENLTLNRTVYPENLTWKNNNLVFSAIDIYKKPKNYDKISKINTYTDIQKIVEDYITRKRHKKTSIGPYGFDITWIGEMPENRKLQLEIPDYPDSVYSCTVYEIDSIR